MQEIIKVKMSSKGEIVIPKKVREQMGLAKDSEIILEVKDKIIELKSQKKDIVKEMEEHAKKANVDVSKWIMGDELYKEVF